jgi:hypothetical protein
MKVNICKFIFYLNLILILFFVFGCSSASQVERVAEKYLVAASENDLATLQELVDPELHRELFDNVMFQAAVMALAGGGSGEYTELDFTTKHIDQTNAIVDYNAKLKVLLMGTQITYSEIGSIRLIKKDGNWYVYDHISELQVPF